MVNIIAWIVLGAIILDTILGAVMNYLNLKSMRAPLPDEFSDVYDEERYTKAGEYGAEKTRFSIITSLYSAAILLLFWFLGGFNALDVWVRGLEYGEIITGLIFISALMIGSSLLTMPFGIYNTFSIEERYGFNKTTWKTYITDKVKSTLLGALIGLPLLAGILAAFEYLGDYAWLVGWSGVVLFSLIMQYIAPTWIMPLFNKFEDLEEGSLREKITNYADNVSFPLKNILVMDGSKRSAHSNAFFTGFGKNKRIALFDTLIENHEEDELLAVVAHEIGHYKKRHIIKSTLISFAYTGIMFFLLGLALQSEMLFEAFYMENMSVYAGLIFFGLLYQPVNMIISPIMQALSRKHEYEADEWASKTTGKPEYMISALKKLSADNLSNLTPHPFYVFMNYSHPPVLQRIRAIRKT